MKKKKKQKKTCLTGGRAPVSVGLGEAASVARRLLWLGTLVSASQPLQISASTADSPVAARSSTGCHRGFSHTFLRSGNVAWEASNAVLPGQLVGGLSGRRTTPRLFHCVGDRGDGPQMKPTMRTTGQPLDCFIASGIAEMSHR